MKIKRILATVTSTGKDDGLPEMLVTTSARDRDNDRVMPEGALLENFRRNPVLLWAHDHGSIPIGTVVSLKVEADGIRIRFRWLENDPFAERVRNAWEQGLIRAASIGFLPVRIEDNEFGGVDFLQWELLEVSLVPVPANQEAVRVFRSLGLAAARKDEIPTALSNVVEDLRAFLTTIPAGDLPLARRALELLEQQLTALAGPRRSGSELGELRTMIEEAVVTAWTGLTGRLVDSPSSMKRGGVITLKDESRLRSARPGEPVLTIK